MCEIAHSDRSRALISLPCNSPVLHVRDKTVAYIHVYTEVVASLEATFFSLLIKNNRI